MANTDNVDFYNILAPHHPTTSRRTEQNIRSMRKDLGQTVLLIKIYNLQVITFNYT